MGKVEDDVYFILGGPLYGVQRDIMLQARDAADVAEMDAKNMRMMVSGKTRLNEKQVHSVSTCATSCALKGKGALGKCVAE